MKIRSRAQVWFVPLLLSLLCSIAASAATLTILHTNDTHGHLMPFSYPSIASPGSDLAAMGERRDIGGIARRATLAAQIRQEVASRGGTVWLVDAGDFCDGTPFSAEYDGEADVTAMGAAGYDLATIGNHEFNHPLAQTKKLIGMAKYSILCANAVETATGQRLAKPYEIRTVDGIRVGVFGMVTRDAATYQAAKEGVTIGGEVETARAMVAEIRPQCDIVLLISHCGREVDEQVAREVPGIDVIVGGHSHSRLPTGEFIWRSEDLRSDDVNGTVIVQAHQWGGELGRLDLLLEKDPQGVWKVDRYRARLIPVTSAIAPDPAIAALLDGYWSPIAARYGEVLGTAEGDFAGIGVDRAEYNFVADAIRETMGTQVEMENLGGVRSPLIQGPITRADMATLDPFRNTIVTYELRGAELKRILEKYSPAVSGIRYMMQNGKLLEATVNGDPIVDDRIYTGSSNSYFANFALKGIAVTDTGRPRLDLLVDYVKAKGSIRPSYDGRRIVTGSDSD